MAGSPEAAAAMGFYGENDSSVACLMLTYENGAPMKIFAFALLLAGAASAQTFHTFQVPGCDATAPAALNDLSEVVGTATCNGLSTAFIRDAAGHFTTFTIDGAPTTATGINIHGA